MTKRITITLDDVEFKGRKCSPTKKDYRNKGDQVHVPKNKYNREKLNPNDAFEEYMEASQEIQGDEYD